ncbi:MAG TPA: hypothetical protein VFJ67_08755 [Thermodesulfobacteriota bacterium]|nr:hypothetical protein [Thermodesulfobacteriota bacterium]
MNYNESLIKRSVELIILLSSIITIAFMITGGCGGGGKKAQPRPTGPPPGCEDIYIDPECPAVSLAGLCRFWGGYFCNFTEINPENPEPETIGLGIQLADCTILDCFTLECEEIFPPVTEMPKVTLYIMGIEIISDIIPAAFSGTADIDGFGFDYVCNPPPIP